MLYAYCVCICVYDIYSVVGFLLLIFGCFFFQAEDGIRYLVRSRGLGDVYKRQTLLATFKHISSKNADYGAAEAYLTFEHDEFTMKPVSYTHLTLPTSDLV